MRRASIFILCALFAVATGCNARGPGIGLGDGGSSDGGGGGGGGGGDGGGGGGGNGGGDGGTPCLAGETQCVGQAFQTCQNGVFTTKTTCTAPQVCAHGLGCAACDPSIPTVCQNGNVYTCNTDGTIGSQTQNCGGQTCTNGACGGAGSNCAAGTGLVYVVDEAGQLLSFNPKNNANTFTVLGQLSCNGGASWPGYGGGTSSPFSMSVDRQANAWILYSSGKIFKVPVSNPSNCTDSGWSPGAGGFQLMGMGFVSDSAGAQTEKLYIAGGNAGSTANGNFAYIDPTTLQPHTVGSYSASTYGPELTGTGGAKLFGYFPGSPSKVVEIDKTNGTQGQSWALPNTSNVMAWAFAHWGGRFYIFVTEGSTPHVFLLDPTNNGKVTDITPAGDSYIVVGAGVSTCAPVQTPVP